MVTIWTQMPEKGRLSKNCEQTKPGLLLQQLQWYHAHSASFSGGWQEGLDQVHQQRHQGLVAGLLLEYLHAGSMTQEGPCLAMQEWHALKSRYNKSGKYLWSFLMETETQLISREPGIQTRLYCCRSIYYMLPELLKRNLCTFGVQKRGIK